MSLDRTSPIIQYYYISDDLIVLSGDWKSLQQISPKDLVILKIIGGIAVWWYEWIFFQLRIYYVCTNKQTKPCLYTFFSFFVLGVQLLYRNNLPVVPFFYRLTTLFGWHFVWKITLLILTITSFQCCRLGPYFLIEYFELLLFKENPPPVINFEFSF